MMNQPFADVKLNVTETRCHKPAQLFVMFTGRELGQDSVKVTARVWAILCFKLQFLDNAHLFYFYI